MKRIYGLAAIVLAAVLSSGILAEAQGPRGGGPGGRHGFGGRGALGGLPLASLNLTQAQQDLVRDIRERQGVELRQIQAKLRDAQAAQQQAVTAIPPNEAAIRQTTLALAEVQAEVAIHQARVRSEIFAALTPEQQATVQKAQAERRQRAQQRQPEAADRRQNRQ